MKKTILLSLFFLFISFAYAIEEGQTFTQEQVDNFDTSQISASFLQCQRESQYAHSQFYVFEYSCLSFTPNDDHYVVYRQPYYYFEYIRDIFTCIEEHSFSQCRDEYMAQVYAHARKKIQGTRNLIESYQTIDEFSGFPDYDPFQ